MEELIALLVLGGLSILLDKLNKKKTQLPQNKEVQSEIPEESLPLPSEIETLFQEDKIYSEDTTGIEFETVPVDKIETIKRNIEVKVMEPSVYEASRVNQEQRLFLDLKGSSLKKAVILKEILDKPRGLKPFG